MAARKLWPHFLLQMNHIALLPLEEQIKVTANWYREICLPELIKKLDEKRSKIGTRGILFQHYNASAHSALKSKGILKANKLHLVRQPSCSPDRAPWDFCLFSRLNKSLLCAKFTSGNVALERYLTLIKEISLDE